MSDTRPPLLAWPGWRNVGEALVLSLAVLVLFSIVYGGADWVTGFRERHYVHLPFELRIPFVPASVLGYMSMYGLFMIAPLILRTRRELRALAASLAAAIVAGGICFLLLPAELAFPEPTDLGGWDDLFALADQINLRYNLVPSLHVALSLVCVDLYARRSGAAGALAFWSWGLTICASTLLLHQHHLLDVVTGAVLALVVNRTVYVRLTAEPMVSSTVR
jgi:membrane-associated phospholipid phosphatase